MKKAKNSTLGDWYEETFMQLLKIIEQVKKNYRTVCGVVNYVYVC